MFKIWIAYEPSHWRRYFVNEYHDRVYARTSFALDAQIYGRDKYTAIWLEDPDGNIIADHLPRRCCVIVNLQTKQRFGVALSHLHGVSVLKEHFGEGRVVEGSTNEWYVYFDEKFDTANYGFRITSTVGG